MEQSELKELDYWAIRRYRRETPVDPFQYPLTAGRDDWIASRLAKCESILEIGAGDRPFLPDLQRAGFRGVFRTMDVGSIECDYRSLEEIKESFDGVIMREVIEHIPRELLYEYLELIRSRLLNADGLLAITTPNPWSPQALWARDFTHITPWPPHDLYAVFRHFGFSKVEIVRVIWPSRALWLKKLYWAVHSKFYDLDYAGGYIALARV